MTLRATLFSKADFRRNVDYDKTHFEAAAAAVIPISPKRAPRDIYTDVQKAQGGEIPSKSKDLEPSYMTSKVSLAATVAEAVQGDSTTVGILSPVRPMGGEGTPVKGKPLSADTMDNPQMAINNNNNPKDGGAADSIKGVVPGVLGSASIELSSEGKWRNIRKSPASPHTQANCLRQILLLQLDLIEQQQQQLQSKDKEIDELKADKETVCTSWLSVFMWSFKGCGWKRVCPAPFCSIYLQVFRSYFFCSSCAAACTHRAYGAPPAAHKEGPTAWQAPLPATWALDPWQRRYVGFGYGREPTTAKPGHATPV